MNYWEIREDFDDYGLGMRSEEAERAYREGCRYGYEKAMKEIRERMGGRDDYQDMGERFVPPYRPGRPLMFRDEPPYDDMGERRRRDSRGRYM